MNNATTCLEYWPLKLKIIKAWAIFLLVKQMYVRVACRTKNTLTHTYNGLRPFIYLTQKYHEYFDWQSNTKCKLLYNRYNYWCNLLSLVSSICKHVLQRMKVWTELNNLTILGRQWKLVSVLFSIEYEVQCNHFTLVIAGHIFCVIFYCSRFHAGLSFCYSHTGASFESNIADKYKTL